MILNLLLAALLVVAGTFGLIGSYGLLRLRDGMQRLHAPTKASTVGLGAALLASMLHGLTIGTGFSWQEIAVMVFIFVTAPVSANYLSKLHLFGGTYTPPPSGTDRPWATFDPTVDTDEPDLPRR
ncbi:cation:proton antiporter [Paragemmobacter straminiformis]|uniref:Monovalent cation/H(+) antiporter subunit G n=1 Tax=Paragemmobacter straminiformis TaxID=2045119 RepID=A0A842IDA8_9RHOB|nr:monovalent cation/H(+) antiporter subunit G [Gemmobacter straminiformis]MBC2837054.1 monovalent cation/H(+) antiporter subunit G [Gemmobacter straminiformis]